MKTDTRPHSRVDLRPPSQVMRLSRLGAFHQSRLSFMRVLTRRMAQEDWQFKRTSFQIDSDGVGHAVYTVCTPEREYSLVAFAHDLPDDQRSDRVIAEAWDATFVLYDGLPEPADIERLYNNVPRQEAGRVTERELSLSRANRSVRLWNHVVEKLAKGQQPDVEQLDEVGYLMRTTAVYGSGKFGAADRSSLQCRCEFAEPFQVEMLTVFLIRWFVRDLVEHMAVVNGGGAAVRLAPEHAQRLGIGNSTGLGMAPFLINHPVLLNNWISAREHAIQRVRSIVSASPDARALFRTLLHRTIEACRHWKTAHEQQSIRIVQLVSDLEAVLTRASDLKLSSDHPWDQLYRWCEDRLGIEAQECVASLILEPYPSLVDELTTQMADHTQWPISIDGSRNVAESLASLEQNYDWALSIDWTQADAHARAWYVSEEKLEPRLGERHQEPIADYEQSLAPARDIAAFHEELLTWDPSTPLATVLMQRPQHRLAARRLQIAAQAPYAEIRDNTIDASMQPIDMLRCKLSFFGATHFDPRSDRWVRIRLFAGAPYPETLDNDNAEHWVFGAVHTSAGS